MTHSLYLLDTGHWTGVNNFRFNRRPSNTAPNMEIFSLRLRLDWEMTEKDLHVYLFIQISNEFVMQSVRRSKPNKNGVPQMK